MMISFDSFVSPGKPAVKYIGNMHGNEVLGRELLLQLAVFLCERYLAADQLVTLLLRHTRILLLPALNPDGREVARIGVLCWLSCLQFYLHLCDQG